jgi:hypothetical protein
MPSLVKAPLIDVFVANHKTHHADRKTASKPQKKQCLKYISYKKWREFF